MAGSTSLQSRRDAAASRPISSALAASGSTSSEPWGEQTAVEPAHYCLRGDRDATSVHRPPKVADEDGEFVRRYSAAVQDAGECVGLRQQADGLGEHAEEAAHQEGRDGIWRVALLQPAGEAGEQLGDLQRDLRPAPRRVERERVRPDGSQAGAYGGVAQLGKVDAEPLAVGEMAVVTPGAGEVGIYVEAEPDVANDQERRRRLVTRQVADIASRLAQRAGHVLVPGHAATHHLPPGRLGRQREQLGLWRRACALLGFQDEAAALVQVDAASGLAIVLTMQYATLEAVGTTTARSRLGPAKPKKVAQLNQERRRICAFSAFGPAPAIDEGVDDDSVLSIATDQPNRGMPCVPEARKSSAAARM